MDFASDLEISLKYDELLIQEYDGDKIQVNVANDTKNDVVVKGNFWENHDYRYPQWQCKKEETDKSQYSFSERI